MKWPWTKAKPEPKAKKRARKRVRSRLPSRESHVSQAMATLPNGSVSAKVCILVAPNGEVGVTGLPQEGLCLDNAGMSKFLTSLRADWARVGLLDG